MIRGTLLVALGTFLWLSCLQYKSSDAMGWVLSGGSVVCWIRGLANLFPFTQGS